jgi:hypothetical protein
MMLSSNISMHLPDGTFIRYLGVLRRIRNSRCLLSGFPLIEIPMDSSHLRVFPKLRVGSHKATILQRFSHRVNFEESEHHLA